mgnify:CR=1 FL=1
MIQRVLLVTSLSMLDAAAAIVTILIPLILIVAAAPWLELEFREPVLAIWRMIYAYTPRLPEDWHDTARLAALWFLPGLLFTRYQLHTDRRALKAGKGLGGAVATEITALTDLVIQLAVILVAGPVILLVRLFQRPVYAWRSDARHYRDRVVFTSGRQGEAIGGQKILFDSKSYLFGQVLELTLWGAAWYFLVVEEGPLFC